MERYKNIRKDCPQTGRVDVVCTRVEDGLLIYDNVGYTLHHLGHLGAAVWRHADGHHGTEEIVQLVTRDLGKRVDASMVDEALREFAAAGLLMPAGQEPGALTPTSRRSLLRTASVGAGLAIVSSIGVHAAVAAQTGPQGYWSGYWTWNGTRWVWTWVWVPGGGGVGIASADSGAPPNGGEAPPGETPPESPPEGGD